MALTQLGDNSPDGSRVQGQRYEVISGVGATRTLTASESGALCLFDVAAGVVYTLPVPEAGLNYRFLVTVAVTSNAHKIVTSNTVTEFLAGGIIMGDVTVATSGDYFEADGTAISALSAAGTTTGGLLGEYYEVVGVSTTVWAINGVCHGAGTLATPFAAS